MDDIPIKRNTETGKSMILHIFIDASTVAYGAIVKVAFAENEITLLIAKARTAPEKTLSVTHLYFVVAVLGAGLTRYVSEAYEKKVKI